MAFELPFLLSPTNIGLNWRKKQELIASNFTQVRMRRLLEKIQSLELRIEFF